MYENIESVNTSNEQSKEVKNATLAFIITILVFVIYGIYSKSGASYAIVVMFISALITGIVAKMPINTIIETLVQGASRMVWLFIMFVLFTPFITFIEQSGAFTELVNLLRPLLESGNKIVFSLVSTLNGIFGIGGAAVAQSVVMDKMFAHIVTSLDISPGLWAMILLVGSQNGT